MATPRRQKQRVKRENSKKVDVVIVKESCMVQGSFCLQKKGALHAKANGVSSLKTKVTVTPGGSRTSFIGKAMERAKGERNLCTACEKHLNMIIYS